MNCTDINHNLMNGKLFSCTKGKIESIIIVDNSLKECKHTGGKEAMRERLKNKKKINSKNK